MRGPHNYLPPASTPCVLGVEGWDNPKMNLVPQDIRLLLAASISVEKCLRPAEINHEKGRLTRKTAKTQRALQFLLLLQVFYHCKTLCMLFMIKLLLLQQHAAYPCLCGSDDCDRL